MKNQDYADFCKGLKKLDDHFRLYETLSQDFVDEMQRLYFEYLRKYFTLDEFRTVIDYYLEHGQEFPTIADLLHAKNFSKDNIFSAYITNDFNDYSEQQLQQNFEYINQLQEQLAEFKKEKVDYVSRYLPMMSVFTTESDKFLYEMLLHVMQIYKYIPANMLLQAFKRKFHIPFEKTCIALRELAHMGAVFADSKGMFTLLIRNDKA
jgi:hypothetical protein